MGILVLCFYKKVMQEILRWEKQVPLTYKLMVKAAPSWAQCRLYDDLKRFKTLDQACAGKPCLIVLYTLKPTGKRQRGGHYSLVIRHGQAACYWSSYGFPVEYEIALSHQASHLKRLLGGGSQRRGALPGNRTHRNVLAVVPLARKPVHTARIKIQKALLQDGCRCKKP